MTTGMKLAAMDLLKADVLESVPLEDQLAVSQTLGGELYASLWAALAPKRHCSIGHRCTAMMPWLEFRTSTPYTLACMPVLS